MIVPDYNLMTPLVVDKLLERPIETALGKKEIDRINRIQSNYDFYHGKQDIDEFGKYIYATDNESWDGKDYEPSKYWTNYYKAFVKRKSRWQMAGNHGINVIPKSDKEADINHAQAVESLLYDLWKFNKMDSTKMQLARERIIAGSIACKLVFNERTGQLHWIWHKATEVFPIYSKDGFNDLIGCDIILAQEDDDDFEKTQYVRQSFRLDKETNECWFDEMVFDEQLNTKRVITEKTYLGLDFIPIVFFNVNSLLTESAHFEDIEDMKVITRILNDMMEDATDSLKFEMFAMTVIKNADLSKDEELQIAPGAVLKVDSANAQQTVDVDTVETSFQWKETFKDQYNRLKSALHELAGLPQVTPSELNFGGMNGQALQVLYHDIIQETHEQWLVWDEDFAELFQKSIWYLKQRTHKAKFKYDKSLIDQTDEIQTKMNFVLPLPDDRKELVDLLITEVEAGFESKKNAMHRLGVKAPDKKIDEIYSELKRFRVENDPYSDTNSFDDSQVLTGVTSPVETEL